MEGHNRIEKQQKDGEEGFNKKERFKPGK